MSAGRSRRTPEVEAIGVSGFGRIVFWSARLRRRWRALPVFARRRSLPTRRTRPAIFASTCSACHKSPQGLAKSGQVAGFLRQHYTTGPEMSAAMAAYLVAAGSAPPPRKAGRSAGGQVRGSRARARPRSRRHRRPAGRPTARRTRERAADAARQAVGAGEVARRRGDGSSRHPRIAGRRGRPRGGSRPAAAPGREPRPLRGARRRRSEAGTGCSAAGHARHPAAADAERAAGRSHSVGLFVLARALIDGRCFGLLEERPRPAAAASSASRSPRGAASRSRRAPAARPRRHCARR